MLARRLGPLVVAMLAMTSEVALGAEPQPTNPAAPGATAKSREAARLEAKAREAFGRGDYEDAAGLFAKAHELSPAAITKYNEAFSWEKADRLPEQADAYEAALAIGTLDADRTAYARERLVELEKSLGVLVVRQPAGATVYVAHAQGRRVPARIHLFAGDHDVVVRTGSRTQRQSLTIEADQVKFLAFDSDPDAPTTRSSGASAAQVIAGWSGIGLGGALAVTSVGLGGAFLSARSDFVDGGRTDAATRQRAVDLRLATNLTLAGALVFGGLGLTLLLTAPDDEPQASHSSVRLRLLPTGVAGELRW